MPSDYDGGMKLSWWKWTIVVVVIGTVAWVFVVHNASNGLSTRIGSWAQILAAAGTLGAAALALSTAQENRSQAEKANEALAAATRPRLSLHTAPGMEQIGHLSSGDPVKLVIMNLSPFDAPKIRVNWTTKDGTPRASQIVRLLADPSPSKGLVAEHVSYSDGASTSATLTLGTASEISQAEHQVRLYYASQFGNGGWMQVHKWTTWSISDDPERPMWRSKHTVESPRWMTLSDMDF